MRSKLTKWNVWVLVWTLITVRAVRLIFVYVQIENEIWHYLRTGENYHFWAYTFICESNTLIGYIESKVKLKGNILE